MSRSRVLVFLSTSVCLALQITAPKILIIEGLHPFYDERVAALCDYKIYLDISDPVKFAWKIQRDMAERGHSLESIQASIEARKPDFDAFIAPQKEKADLTIQVCSLQALSLLFCVGGFFCWFEVILMVASYVVPLYHTVLVASYVGFLWWLLVLYHCTKRWSSYTPSWGLVSLSVSACFWVVLVLLCPTGKCMSVVCSSYRVQIAIPDYMPRSRL